MLVKGNLASHLGSFTNELFSLFDSVYMSLRYYMPRIRFTIMAIYKFLYDMINVMVTSLVPSVL